MIVQVAINGKAGVDDFSSSPIGYYDAILMDIRMPVMDGFEASSAIRSLERKDAKSVVIIAMTADAFKDDVEKCFQCGMNAHLAKPIGPRKPLSKPRASLFKEIRRFGKDQADFATIITVRLAPRPSRLEITLEFLRAFFHFVFEPISQDAKETRNGAFDEKLPWDFLIFESEGVAEIRDQSFFDVIEEKRAGR
jgi:CheY-like chemotaxis protein